MERLEPFWFPKEHHAALGVFLKQNHDDVVGLDDIRAEVDIAHTRLKLLTINPQFLSKALGYTQETIPLYFTTSEKNTLLTLPNLPEQVKGLLK